MSSSRLQAGELIQQPVDRLDTLAEAGEAGRTDSFHVLRESVRVGDSSFARCSCGGVVEVFAGADPVCPVGEVMREFDARHLLLVQERHAALVRAFGQLHLGKQELYRALTKAA